MTPALHQEVLVQTLQAGRRATHTTVAPGNLLWGIAGALRRPEAKLLRRPGPTGTSSAMDAAEEGSKDGEGPQSRPMSPVAPSVPTAPGLHDMTRQAPGDRRTQHVSLAGTRGSFHSIAHWHVDPSRSGCADGHGTALAEAAEIASPAAGARSTSCAGGGAGVQLGLQEKSR